MERTIIRIILVVGVVSLLVYLFAKEITHVYALHQENEKVKVESLKLEKANSELMKKIELIDADQAYKEKIIRQELGMIKKGEKVYRFQE
ncbi:MAG: septum formation initiator family protein [Thermodesulfobacteriota bacterium]|jgi:cell division protein FtsB|nr:septum formation initiator family protein [Candidatus Dadabacteria bacterium]MCZ6469271.1 septum formation initiator family protein [Candidatus Dadabacteria bacterium]MCZ6527623.1 septum formation initiator family protein [Candidatus Dadabacteria bacterium]MCZ6555949.1 septum formation initiator family protein [Candidatus Dadabacteria bacterium]MCZ6638626.1 septum formation initiator family protein [Candidatus Dadabacteria bacterium]